jgi:hypothetical protein
MSARICLANGHFIDNPIRRLLYNPKEILSPCVNSHKTVVDSSWGGRSFLDCHGKHSR